MTLQQAMSLIQRRRPQAQPIPAFLEFLQQTENSILPPKDRPLTESPPTQSTAVSTFSKPKVAPILGPQPPKHIETKDNHDDDNKVTSLKRLAKFIVQTPIGPSQPQPLPSSRGTLQQQQREQQPAEADRSGTSDPGENGFGFGTRSALSAAKKVPIGPCLPPPTVTAKTTVNDGTFPRHDFGPELPPGFSME
jgi:hypothetical protein